MKKFSLRVNLTSTINPSSKAEATIGRKAIDTKNKQIAKSVCCLFKSLNLKCSSCHDFSRSACSKAEYKTEQGRKPIMILPANAGSSKKKNQN